MVNTNIDERIAALKARAEAMGLRFEPDTICNEGNYLLSKGEQFKLPEWVIVVSNETLDVAHALLDGLSMVRGPVVPSQIAELGIWGCSKLHKCGWKAFALDKYGISVGTIKMSTGAWQKYHTGMCDGDLIQIVPPVPKGKQWQLMLCDVPVIPTTEEGDNDSD